MKLQVFENQFTREQLLCRDSRQVQIIDGEEYLKVQKYLGKQGSLIEQSRQREFLVRKNALKMTKAH